MTPITKNIFDMIIFLSPLIVTMSMRGKTIFSFSTFLVTTYLIFSHILVTSFFLYSSMWQGWSLSKVHVRTWYFSKVCRTFLWVLEWFHILQSTRPKRDKLSPGLFNELSFIYCVVMQ